MTRLGLMLVWLLRLLPLPILASLGQGLGYVLAHLAHERRRVVATNLALCFPELSEKERRRLLYRQFQAFARSALERGIIWWGTVQDIQRLVHLEGEAHMHGMAHQPVIWLAPHFVGLDMGGIRLATQFPVASIYSQQKNRYFNDFLLRRRARFPHVRLVSRQQGLRPVIQAISEGVPFYYLPDQDFGAKDALFIPFFGVKAATVSALARLAKITGARVIPAVTRQLPRGKGYILKLYAPWENFPSGDLIADTQRMNAFIEERVKEMPEQYNWLHKRFKTRPPGEVSIYN